MGLNFTDASTGGAAVVMALAALLTAVAGVYFSQRGRRSADAQQAIANKLEQDKLDLDILRTRVQLAETSEAEQRRLRLLAETELQERKDLAQLITHEQSRDCQAIHRQLAETLTLLRGVVHDEVAVAAADEVLALPEHPHR